MQEMPAMSVCREVIASQKPTNAAGQGELTFLEKPVLSTLNSPGPMPSFAGLLLRTVRRISPRWGSFAVSILLFGLLLFFVQIAEKQYGIWKETPRIAIEAMKTDVDSLHTLLERQKNGEDVKSQLRATQQRISNRLQVQQSARASSLAVFDRMPVLFLWLLASLLLLVGCSLHVIALLLFPHVTFFSAMQWVGRVLPMMCLSVLAVFILSNLWLPMTVIFLARLRLAGDAAIQTILVFCGYIFAILAFPRLLFAPLLFLENEHSIPNTLRASIEMSRGHWGKILADVLLLAAILFVADIAIFFLVQVILQTPLTNLLLQSILLTGSIAIAVLFVLELACAVRAHPYIPEESILRQSDTAIA